jgi:hypothetical protein
MEHDRTACARCGEPLRGRPPRRGLAHRFDPRPYCEACLRAGDLAPTPTQPVATLAESVPRPF